MSETSEILRLRVLLCFYRAGGKGCTVTSLSKTLEEEKYALSRVLIGLEKEKLLDRSNVRHPVLTQIGMKEAERLAERMEVAVNHLLYEGVDIESAKKDASVWALRNTEQTMDIIRNTDEKYKVKYKLRDKKHFSGADLCKRMKDGVYQLPFLIYREQVKNGTNISMANEGFEHPCVLQIVDGIGYIQLHAVSVVGNSVSTGKRMRGKIKRMKYLINQEFVETESNGTIYTLPASALQFVNIGSGSGAVLHGSVCLKMQCSVGIIHMPESIAIFTLLI